MYVTVLHSESAHPRIIFFQEIQEILSHHFYLGTQSKARQVSN
jgi:hypothetical protein